MRAPLSVVIPTLNAADALPSCLLSLMEGVETGLIRELVVSDGGSDDETPRMAEEAGAVLVTGAASRGAQLRRGVAATSGEWLLVLHADSVLQPGWSEAVSAHLAQREGQAAYFRLRFDTGGGAAYWVALWADLRARILGLPYGDQGLLIRRTLYDAVGGYLDIALMEDVALVRKLKGRLSRLPVSITTSARKYQRDGWMRRGARNLSLLIRYLLGADPEKLARRY